MPLIKRSLPWKWQPQLPAGVNPGCDFAQNIRLLWAASAPFVNQAMPGGVGKAIGLPTFAASPQGKAVAFPGTAYIELPGAPVAPSPRLTMAAGFVCPNAVIAMVTSTSSNTGGTQIYVATDNTLRLFVSGIQDIPLGIALTPGDTYNVVIASNTVASVGYVKNLRTGAYATGSNSPVTTIQAGDGKFSLGTGGTYTTFEDNVIWAMSMDGQFLSERQAKELLNNPWQLFKPRTLGIYFDSAVGGGTVHNVSITETLAAADAYAAQMVAAVGLTEAGSATDSSSTIATLIAALQETASASESATAQTTTQAQAVEAASAGDAIAASIATTAAAVEASSVTDSAACQLVAQTQITESASATDAASATAQFLAALIEAASASDASTTGPVTTAAITESASASDAVSAVATLIAQVFEAASAADSSTTTAQLLAFMLEPGVAADSQSAATSAVYNVGITEMANALDAIIASLSGTAVFTTDGPARIGATQNRALLEARIGAFLSNVKNNRIG